MMLEYTVKEFVDKANGPLLLGYSGGPDSKALLYALLKTGVSFHIAHVDHGWREESRAEAANLAQEAALLGIPFHSIRLAKVPEKNLEDYGREARLQFFKTLFEKIPFQALLLAHHADDVAETVLKRVLEGANLPHLGGMAPRGELHGMAVWRPLLRLKKRDILSYLEERSISFITDSTNSDPKFLRTRLRQLLGKEIDGNLTLLSDRAYELKEYLDRKVEPLWANRVEGPMGIALDLNGVERIEAKHVLHKYMQISSRAQLVNGKFSEGGRDYQVHDGWVFQLRPGNYRWNIEPAVVPKPFHWTDVWKGAFTVNLESEFWRKNKVPPFLRIKAEKSGCFQFSLIATHL